MIQFNLCLEFMFVIINNIFINKIIPQFRTSNKDTVFVCIVFLKLCKCDYFLFYSVFCLVGTFFYVYWCIVCVMVVH